MEKIIIDNKIKAFFFKNQLYENISFRFGLESREGFNKCVTQQTHMLNNSICVHQHLL